MSSFALDSFMIFIAKKKIYKTKGSKIAILRKAQAEKRNGITVIPLVILLFEMRESEKKRRREQYYHQIIKSKIKIHLEHPLNKRKITTENA